MVCLMSVVVALQLSGCDQTPAEAMDGAKARIAKKDDAAAEIDLKNILQENPDSAEARYLLGVQVQKRGDHASALIELLRARTLKHPEHLVVPSIVRSLLAQGKVRQIVEQYSNVDFVDAVATAELQGLVAQAMHFEGDTKAATDLINKASVGAPSSEPVLLVKANFAAQAGNSELALAVLDDLIVKKPDSYLAWTMKGNVLGVLPDKRELAIAAFRKALAIKPDEVPARTGLIAIALQRRDFATAAQDLAELQKASPEHPNTLFYEANLLYAKGDYAQAQSKYQSVLRVMPESPAVLLGAADNELRLNATAQAEKLAARALFHAPSSVPARLLLAQIHLRTGQPAKVVSTLSSLVESPNAAPETLALAAQGFLLNGDASAADQLYLRLAKLKPTDPGLRTLLATAGAGKTDNAQVYDTLQRISAEDTGVTADLAIISARLRARQFDAALKAIDGLIKKQPDQAMGHQLRAQALVQSNDLAGARQALELALTKDATYLPAILSLAAIDVRNQKPKQAKERIEDLIKKQPANAQALVALAEISAEAGMPSEVVLGYIERAVAIDRTDVAIWSALIDQQVKFGDLRASLTSSQAAVVANPNSIQLLDRLGRAQARNGQAEQALSTFRLITGQHPRSLVGLLGEAEVHIVSGKMPEAGRMIGKVLERDPQNLPALALAFGSALQQKQHKTAADIARKVQQLRPADAAGVVMEAEVEAQQGRRDSAVSLLRKALVLNAPGAAAIKLHQALSQGGKDADSPAAAMATAWLKDHPRDLDFLTHLATHARQQGRTDLAEQRYREVLALQPNHVSALNDLAMMLAQQGKAEAVPLAEQALKRSPENPALLDTLAHALAANKQLPLALDAQRRAVLLAPNEPSLRLTLAQFEFQSGDKVAARRSLDGVVKQASKLNADDRAAMAALAKALEPA